MDGVVREMLARVGNIGVDLCLDDAKQKLSIIICSLQKKKYFGRPSISFPFLKKRIHAIIQYSYRDRQKIKDNFQMIHSHFQINPKEEVFLFLKTEKDEALHYL